MPLSSGIRRIPRAIWFHSPARDGQADGRSESDEGRRYAKPANPSTWQLARRLAFNFPTGRFGGRPFDKLVGMARMRASVHICSCLELRQEKSEYCFQNRKKPCNPSPCRIVKPRAERWPSGRRRSPAKGVYRKRYRGFESLLLRHFSITGNADRLGFVNCGSSRQTAWTGCVISRLEHIRGLMNRF